MCGCVGAAVERGRGWRAEGGGSGWKAAAAAAAAAAAGRTPRGAVEGVRTTI